MYSDSNHFCTATYLFVIVIGLVTYSDVCGLLFREMQTPVGVLKRIAVHDGSMTNTLMYQRAEACAMLSRKASATVEHPANFRMMSR